MKVWWRSGSYTSWQQQETAFSELAFHESAFDETAFRETLFGESTFGELAFDELLFRETAGLQNLTNIDILRLTLWFDPITISVDPYGSFL